MSITLTKSHALKVLTIVDHPDGLTSGKGKPIPGQLCIEAAVCLALGLPHDDNPPCVGDAVRSFKIQLNDCNWSTNQARAKGMRKLAVAQLGSDTIDQKEFAKLLALKTVQRIVPGALRAAAKVQNKEHAAKLEDCAKACEASKDLNAASDAARAASDAARAARAASDASYASYASDAARAASDAARAARAASDASYASYASDAARAASDAARAARAASDARAASYAARAASAASDASYASYASDAARAASDAARAARAASDARAARSAARAARAASYASYAASYASDAARAAASYASDSFLILMADIGLECLQELKSPGCKWLDLCEA